MTDGDSIAVQTKDWWVAWYQADYSWQGLLGHQIAGEGPNGERNLQDYWRGHASTGGVRSDDMLLESGELERDPDGRLWHIAHVPAHWINGAQTWKADRKQEKWRQLERLIRMRLDRASEPDIDEEYYEEGIEREDGRAQLQGCVLRRITWPRQPGKENYIVANQVAFLSPFIVSRIKMGNGARFVGALFESSVLFRMTEVKDIDFSNAVFGRVARFVSTKFGGVARFCEAKFQHATFSDGQFLDKSDFSNSEFRNVATFSGAEFAGKCNFKSARLFDFAGFSGASFGTDSIFSDAIFEKSVDFSGSPIADQSTGSPSAIQLTFGQKPTIDGEMRRQLTGNVVPSTIDGPLKRKAFRRTSFSGTVFQGDADFSNRTFLGYADFSGARFCGIAKFHDAKLHQDTSFAGARFAMARCASDGTLDTRDREYKLKRAKQENLHFEEYERSFRTLKLAMEGQRARREEARFYRKELQARRLRPSIPAEKGEAKEVTRIEKIVSDIYKFSSEFGESIGLPIMWLFVLCAVFSGVYAILAGEFKFECWAFEATCSVSPAVSLAAERTWLPFLMQSQILSAWANESGVGTGVVGILAGIVHRISATLLIFLSLLAARRKFQIS